MAEESPHEKYPALKVQRNKLEDYFDVFTQAGMATMESGQVYPMDLIFIGIIKRSIDLIGGFISLIDKWNVVCAAPIIRMQLDNLLRMVYLSTLQDSKEICKELLSGKPMDKLKDSKGRRLTDACLRDYARLQFPWLDDVYKKTSKFIHFSDRHMFLPMSNIQDDTRTVVYCVAKCSPNIKESDISSYYNIMIRITDVILSYLQSWGKHKKKIAHGNLGDTNILNKVKDTPPTPLDRVD